ncbi:MAG: zf-HC2 domain-containing protein [Gemmatimonadaceae bacterium]
MDCKRFRDNHLAFMDNTLSDADMVAMQRHLAECEPCDCQDTALRRGLLVFRNLPSIEPSAEFASRLDSRLRQLHQADARADVYRGPGIGSFLIAAAGVVAAGFLAISALDWDEPARDIAFAPVVASRPDVPPSPIVSHSVVASATAGMPLWSAAMLAEQAPVHFVRAEVRLASWQP